MACALTGLHLLAAEVEDGSSGSQTPKSGDAWRYGCPKSLVWIGGDDDWAESESTSSFEEYKHNVGNFALEIIGQHWSGEMVSLFLEDGELGRVALSCHTFSAKA